MAIQFDNFYESTLSAAITDSDLYIPLVNPPPTATEGWLLIDWDVPASREFIYYTSKDATGVTVTAPNRGRDGTTAIPHLKNAKVRMNLNKGMIEDILDGVNIVDGAVTTPKLADNVVTTAKVADANVTSAKLAQSFVKGRRQSTAGTNSDFSGYLIQCGQVNSPTLSTTAAQSVTITFPTPFSGVPIVTTSVLHSPGGIDDVTITTTSVNTTGLTLRMRAGIVGTAQPAVGSWIAIGPA